MNIQEFFFDMESSKSINYWAYICWSCPLTTGYKCISCLYIDDVYNIRVKIYIQIYIVCGIGLCLGLKAKRP
jgi:hypothetical protein